MGRGRIYSPKVADSFMRFFVRGVHPELDSFSRGVYTERYEILRQAQNDTRNEVLPQDDKDEGLHRMTNQRAPSEIQLFVVFG